MHIFVLAKMKQYIAVLNVLILQVLVFVRSL